MRQIIQCHNRGGSEVWPFRTVRIITVGYEVRLFGGRKVGFPYVCTTRRENWQLNDLRFKARSVLCFSRDKLRNTQSGNRCVNYRIVGKLLFRLVQSEKGTSRLIYPFPRKKQVEKKRFSENLLYFCQLCANVLLQFKYIGIQLSMV